MNRNYLSRLVGAVSRLSNVAIFNGHPSESVSGRCWRMRLERPESRWWWRLCRFVDVAFFWEQDHCQGAYLEDIEYAAERLERHRTFKG